MRLTPTLQAFTTPRFTVQGRHRVTIGTLLPSLAPRRFGEVPAQLTSPVLVPCLSRASARFHGPDLRRVPSCSRTRTRRDHLELGLQVLLVRLNLLQCWLGVQP